MWLIWRDWSFSMTGSTECALKSSIIKILGGCFSTIGWITFSIYWIISPHPLCHYYRQLEPRSVEQCTWELFSSHAILWMLTKPFHQLIRLKLPWIIPARNHVYCLITFWMNCTSVRHINVDWRLIHIYNTSWLVLPVQGLDNGQKFRNNVHFFLRVYFALLSLMSFTTERKLVSIHKSVNPIVAELNSVTSRPNLVASRFAWKRMRV